MAEMSDFNSSNTSNMHDDSNEPRISNAPIVEEKPKEEPIFMNGKCRKCNNTGIVKDPDGKCHTCWDCLMAGRLNQHSESLPENDRFKL